MRPREQEVRGTAENQPLLRPRSHRPVNKPGCGAQGLAGCPPHSHLFMQHLGCQSPSHPHMQLGWRGSWEGISFQAATCSRGQDCARPASPESDPKDTVPAFPFPDRGHGFLVRLLFQPLGGRLAICGGTGGCHSGREVAAGVADILQCQEHSPHER